jgi:hypothetical protein
VGNDVGAPGVTVETGSQPVTVRAVIRNVLDELVLLALAGISTGVVVAGIGSRLTMMALRLTSHERVIGMQSDDDFTIGRFTFFGTYNLLVLGAAFGVIGAGLYQWVRPWLIGPRWFRYLTVGLACGAVVGSMLLHADGIDFRVLTPTWLAITLFIALPFVYGVAVAWTVDRFDREGSFARDGRARWIVAVIGAALFPLSLVFLGVAFVVLCVWVPARDAWHADGTPVPRALTFVVRGVWLAIASLGMIAVVNDIRDITAVA